MSKWEQLFNEKLKTVHRRNIKTKTKRILRKTSSALSSMKARSRKMGVNCTITLDELRELTLMSYGELCKYTGRKLTIENMVYDHIIPISKGGDSNKDNIQVISRFANNVKGSMNENDLLTLLQWIDKLPEELGKEVLFRLAGGRKR